MTIQTTMTAGLMLCGTLYVMREYGVSRIMVALTIVITLMFLMVRRAIERKLMQQRFLQGRETRKHHHIDAEHHQINDRCQRCRCLQMPQQRICYRSGHRIESDADCNEAGNQGA